jgi:hypothetical protein
MGTRPTNNDPSGFWKFVGRAVDNQGFLDSIGRQSGENVANWRTRIARMPDVASLGLIDEDIDALFKEYNGKTIIDLLRECKSNWPSGPSAYGSFRT